MGAYAMGWTVKSMWPSCAFSAGALTQSCVTGHTFSCDLQSATASATILMQNAHVVRDWNPA